MEKKTRKKIIAAFLFVLILAAYMEHSGQLLEDGTVKRNAAGEGDAELQLRLDAEDLLEDYPYPLTVKEEKLTKEEAQEELAKAKAEIDATFCKEGETLSGVTEQVFPQESYADGKVTAEWYFDDGTLIQPDGKLQEEMLSQEGSLIGAEAELSCGGCQEVYTFSFLALPKEKTESEALLAEIKTAIEDQQERSGEGTLVLPKEVRGIPLTWSEEKEHLVLPIFLMEGLVLLLIPVWKREQKKKEEKRRRELFLLDYPEIVSKITVLMGAGMSLKQSWNQISARYTDKRLKNHIELRPAYEEVVRTNRAIQGGESERLAYQKFGERAGIYAYYRFVRILIQNLQKGTGGLCALLEQEAETAFEERKQLARKLGEEAGTRMLIPLILMMGIVMAIVVMPAIIDFI